MSQPVSALPTGVQNAEAARATAKISLNSRVQTATGPICVMSDVMQFPGTFVVGNWLVGATRVLVMGVPVVNQASAGISVYPALPAPGPMVVVEGDARVKAM